MKKKWGFSLALLFIIVVVAVFWSLARVRNPVVVVVGDLPPADLAVVKRVVRRDMMQRVFPDFSWSSVKSLGPNLRAYFKYKIVEVDAPDSFMATVKVGNSNTAAASTWVCQYSLFKSANVWRINLISARTNWVPPRWSNSALYLAPPPPILPRPIRTDTNRNLFLPGPPQLNTNSQRPLTHLFAGTNMPKYVRTTTMVTPIKIFNSSSKNSLTNLMPLEP